MEIVIQHRLFRHLQCTADDDFQCVFSHSTQSKIKGISVFRTVFYLPTVLSGVAVYILWMQLLSPSAGLINTFLGWFHIPGPAWLFDPQWTKPALILMKIWSSGGAMLLYLATLQNVPRSLYESAEIDGAGVWGKFKSITLPLITPIIFTM